MMEQDADQIADMMEKGQDDLFEDDDLGNDAAEASSVPGPPPAGAGNRTVSGAQPLIGDAEGRKESSHGASDGPATADTEKEDHVLAREFVRLVDADDKSCLRDFFLTRDVNDIFDAFVDLETLFDKKRQKSIESHANKMLPAKEWAALVRERKELKSLVAKLMRREMSKRVGRTKK